MRADCKNDVTPGQQAMICFLLRASAVQTVLRDLGQSRYDAVTDEATREVASLIDETLGKLDDRCRGGLTASLNALPGSAYHRWEEDLVASCRREGGVRVSSPQLSRELHALQRVSSEAGQDEFASRIAKIVTGGCAKGEPESATADPHGDSFSLILKEHLRMNWSPLAPIPLESRRSFPAAVRKLTGEEPTPNIENGRIPVAA